MTDLRDQQTSSSPPGVNGNGSAVQDDDPLARLHKMSTTAGLGTTDYVAINALAVVSVFLGFASLLAMLDNLLLALPVLAIICSIWALTQIRRSGGTQSGQLLAILGLVLAVGCFAVVGGRSWMEHARVQDDERKTIALVGQLNDLLMSGKYAEAYALMGDSFKERVKEPEWAQRWEQLRNGRTTQKLKGLESNQRVVFETKPTTGEEYARGFLIPQFENAPSYDRLDVMFKKRPDGSWAIEDLPQFFPADQARKPPSGASQQPGR